MQQCTSALSVTKVKRLYVDDERKRQKNTRYRFDYLPLSWKFAAEVWLESTNTSFVFDNTGRW